MKGFSLIELFITLAIAAILLGLAAPAYQKFVVNSRSQSIGASMVAALRLARSEAITKGTNVQICPLNAAQNGCNAVTADWKNGWRVWVPNGGEVVQDYPINLTGYANYCCGSGILEYTPTGTPSALTCSCPTVVSGTGKSQTNINYVAYFQINPPNCTNVYTIQIDTIGRSNINTGVACQ